MRINCCLVLFVCLAALLTSLSSATLISDGVFGSSVLGERRLLQAKKHVLNDLSNDCASSMFSYINLHGRYPPGLFANECRDSRQGLECPAPPPGSNRSTTTNNNNNNNAGHKIVGGLWMLILVTFLLMQFM
ncbi:GPI-anchored protein LORELEI [Striga asiatica]|uniref:GPI-anchored protein LORELEI n=1 Tax=Striga asiatica TaxID=4170 RepID=A0A5A7R5M7_STRAF|nr:GPI-anchored protein LORELEI [Striga asiatica]